MLTVALYQLDGCVCAYATGPGVGSMVCRRRGVEYGPSFEFLMHKENLSLSTNVAHLKRFFSTTKHGNKSFLSKYHTKRYGTP
jgi:hypothetical protein